MVKQGGKIEGEFDSSFLPFITVEVCEWDGSVCVGQLIRSCTSASTGSERLRISSGSGGQHYHVNWHTGEDELDSDSDYRIRGLMGALEVGFADVDVVDTGTELKGVGGGFVGLVNGRTLPIEFMITDALEGGAVVGSNGGVFTLIEDAVVLEFPANALAGDTPITVEQVQDVSGLPQPISGPVFDFGPDGIVFDVPVTLTIGYDPSEIPPGVPEERLGIYKLDDNHPFWDPVESVVDLSDQTVSGDIDGFTAFVARPQPEQPSVLTHNFTYGSGPLQSSAEVGIWMFKDPILDLDDIADWLRETTFQHEHWENFGVIIHEPINVLWIDYASPDDVSARERVEEYLQRQGFFGEDSGHGIGYSGWINTLVPQWPNDVAWVDTPFPDPNNHGRVFPAANVGTTQDPVFYTLGAFSREDVGFTLLNPVLHPHAFISFDTAQQQVLGGTPADPTLVGEILHGWTYEKLDATWRNILPLTTADHKGVAVLVLPVLQPHELCSNYPGHAIATFEDANLEAAVRARMGLGAQDDLTCDRFRTLVGVFRANAAGIVSLVGIQNVNRIVFLDLGHNSIIDISPLSGFGPLEHLILNDNSIIDISALSGVFPLRGLDLSGNTGLSNIQPILDNVTLSLLSTVNLTNTLVSCADVVALHAKLVTVISGCPPLPPIVKTLSALAVTTTSFTAVGAVKPDGLGADAWFEWGSISSLAIFNTTPVVNIGSTTVGEALLHTHVISSLQPGTTYYYRIVGRNSVGTSRGNIRSVTTLP